MQYFAYIVECADGTLYTGYTNNLEHRIFAHNNLKTGARYTKFRRPVVLKYSEEFRTKSEAMSREAALKKLSRNQKLSLF